MRRIKIFAVALVLALFGLVYAAGKTQDSKMSCGTDKADCCASCSCCKEGKAEKKGASAHHACATTECCKGEDSCCGSCCKGDKSGKAHATKAEACDASKGEACCGCCNDGCCAKGKTKTN